jgi:hypothetical protein
MSPHITEAFMNMKGFRPSHFASHLSKLGSRVSKREAHLARGINQAAVQVRPLGIDDLIEDRIVHKATDDGTESLCDEDLQGMCQPISPKSQDAYMLWIDVHCNV